MDSRQSTPGRPEANQDWVERLQWLGIKVEKPGMKGTKILPAYRKGNVDNTLQDLLDEDLQVFYFCTLSTAICYHGG